MTTSNKPNNITINIADLDIARLAAIAVGFRKAGLFAEFDAVVAAGIAHGADEFVIACGKIEPRLHTTINIRVQSMCADIVRRVNADRRSMRTTRR